MSICLPFLLYVCGFFSKDHAYTSIEDSMAIGDPRVNSPGRKFSNQKGMFYVVIKKGKKLWNSISHKY